MKTPTTGSKCPAEIYSASSRPYSGLPDLTYPLHDRDALVTACGRICMHRKRLNISTVLAGQRLCAVCKDNIKCCERRGWRRGTGKFADSPLEGDGFEPSVPAVAKP
jgi:hypothetical protein